MDARINQAAALHRQAAAIAAAAEAALDAAPPAVPDLREQREVARRLRAAAALLAPGWLGAPLASRFARTPLNGPGTPMFVRIGTAQPLDDARFPALVPLLGAGHLSIDTDGRDPRVAALLRALLVRLLAATPAGSLLVRAVAGAGTGPVFAPFAPLADAGLLPPPATDLDSLRTLLTEAEQWIRPARSGATRRDRHDRTLLLVVAALPEPIGAADLARFGSLARHGPEAGLNLVVAGWPPAPPAAGRGPADAPAEVRTAVPALPRATAIAVREKHALLGNPPGGSFADPARGLAVTGLNAPVLLDGDPPARLLAGVCAELAARSLAGPRHSLADLLPEPSTGLWAETGSAGLTTTVGHDGARPVTLRFSELTPHWLLGGRSGSGKTAFLVNVVYGLCARYRPADLALYATTFAATAPLADLLTLDRDGTRLPHLSRAGTGPEHALAVLRELGDELARRLAACQAAGVRRLVELPGGGDVPRVLCVIDDLHALRGRSDPVAVEAVQLLATLARGGRNQGMHLLLAGAPVGGAGRSTNGAVVPTQQSGDGWEAIHGQCPVRVALPGGAAVLEPANDSAAGLPLGTAVVNTAGGLGGPRGATRGHERLIHFPDPHAEPETLWRIRQRLRDAGERAAR
ncbi:FtsK/SpoIIIE domain-containing protein [Solwaraspora sp. WMMD1047]|uniref:FtsK/SpoIIIE domain-containing protein n=1 Tax=Solwaraspora sp. WMMD1047 TaxID=3016102 RepID=UPI002417CD03|nr:FtsK/SpoIIIE domain-containing protein [Solwaraspora sp. WMMD1047]MDG4828048.1 FtsK/SpoIIIE domain-containing protein [Solwaraspora sp. WMMD1047]